MRVVFDARHLQTVSRTRGIGRYSRNLLAAFARRAPDDVARLGIPPERIRVIPEAVDLSFHPPSRETGAAVARERFGVPGRYVLYVGQFDPRKNMDGLFAAFARAADRDRDLRLVIVGTLGKLAGLMRDALARSRVDPARVVITGEVDDGTLAALYAGAECLLHSAW